MIKIVHSGGGGVTDHGLLTGLTDDDHTGYVPVDGTRAMTGDLTITKNDPSIIFNAGSASDTKFWLGVQDDAGNDDDDTLQIGKGTSPGTTPYLYLDNNGNLSLGVPPAVFPFSLDILRADTSLFRALNSGTLGAGSGAGLVGGTTQNPSGADQRLGFLIFAGNSTQNAVGITGYSAESWAGAGKGAYIRVETTTLGASSRTEKLRLTAPGNLGLMTTAPGGSSTVGVGVVSLANQTAPVGGVADQSSIFAADVTASSELFGLDEAGNTPQLTPHPGDLLNGLPVEPTGPYAYPWAYAASNPYLGKRITVDMAGVVKAVEQLTGQSFTALEDLPPEKRADWDTGQEIQRTRRQAEIDQATARRAELATEIAAEKDAAKKAELQRQRDELKVPLAYRKKRPPQWMLRRGVVTQIPAAGTP